MQATEEAGRRSSFEIHSGVAELADRYQGLILDQFGVLHNGTHVRTTIPHLAWSRPQKTESLPGWSPATQAARRGGLGLRCRRWRGRWRR
jgi:hypothetical protein